MFVKLMVGVGSFGVKRLATQDDCVGEGTGVLVTSYGGLRVGGIGVYVGSPGGVVGCVNGVLVGYTELVGT
jgi:hypothetical protein